MTPAATPEQLLHDAPPDVPLAVDLDGTLVRTDTLYESWLLLLKCRPLLALLGPAWWLAAGGKARLKAELAARVALDPASLPYNEEVLSFLRAERARGRRLVLATAAHERIARAVAEHLGLFERVLATADGVNLRGERKLARLKETLGCPFDYAGNGLEDLVLWRDCRGAVVVHADAALVRRARALGRPVRVFERPRAGLRRWVKMLRVHQWAKNVLLFVPLLAAHRAGDPGLLARALVAFAAFSLCASSVYVLNDLLDLESDRRHPTKRRRPFAAGDVPVPLGLVLAPVLLAAGFALALWRLPHAFVLLLAGYYALTFGYSLWLKQVVMLDVLVLAGLYTVRVLGGALAVGVTASAWLLTFSMFLFLSLALVKRLSEVRRLRERQEHAAHGRGYLASDYEQLGALGVSAGYMSVLVLALYLNSQDVTRLYAHPERLWLLCPLALYWVSRVWLLAHRGEVNEDPLVFALKDRVSYVVGALGAALVWLAT